MSAPLPRIYTDLSDWYLLLTAPEDYAEEAAFYWQCLIDAAEGPIRTMLELGCGSGANASHLKRQVTMTLTDPSREMLALARSVNPDLELIEGDMRSLRLGRQFDAVFVHDAVMYLTTEDDLGRAIETATIHLRPGGVALFAPDALRETFREQTDCGGHNGRDGRALRYLEWSHDPDPTDSTFVTDYVYAYREGDGPPVCETERHLLGLFSRETWLRLLDAAGLDTTARPLVHSEVEPGEIEVFVCRKRRS